MSGIKKETLSILGTGDFARALSKQFIRHGYEVYCGSRTPTQRDITSIDMELQSVHITSAEVAITASDIIFLAVPFAAQENIILSHKRILCGKVLVDVSNRTEKIKAGSQAQHLASLCPQTSVVKGFNTLSAYRLESDVQCGDDSVYICGDDAAKALVSQVIRRIGFTPVDRGTLEAAKALEDQPNRLFPGWGLPTLSVVLCITYWTAYITYHNHYKGPYSMATWPVYTMNMVFGCTAITLLSLCYLAGHVATAAQLVVCTKYRRFPGWLDRWLLGRKQLGLYALMFAGMHCCLSVVAMSRAYFPWYFMPGYSVSPMTIPANQTDDISVPLAARMNWEGEVIILSGCVALTLMAIVGLTSIPPVGALLNWREWTFIQSYVGYSCLVVSSAHLLVRGVLYWKYLKTPPKVLAVSSLQAAVLPLLTLALKVITLMPCVYVTVKRLRQGWEPVIGLRRRQKSTTNRVDVVHNGNTNNGYLTSHDL